MITARHVLSSTPDPRPFGSLAEWWPRQRTIAEQANRPIDAAILGGFAGDRLAPAFAAGYQAALRALVPDLPSHCVVSFCVTEKGGAHPRAITSTLEPRGEGRYALSGEKRWATLSNGAEVLLVVAKAGEDAATRRNHLRVARIFVPSPGLRLTAMPETPFVPEIPHAEVSLRDVLVKEEDLLPGDGYERYVKPFRTIEDVHVNAAIAGYLVREARLLDLSRTITERLASLIIALREIALSAPSDPSTHVALGGSLTQLRSIIEEMQGPWRERAPERHERFVRDSPLFSVAEKARGERLSRAWERLAAGQPAESPVMLAAPQQKDSELREFFALSVDMLGIADLNGRFMDISQSWETTLGHTREELLAVPYINFVHPEDRAMTEETARQMGEGEKAITFQNRYRTRDGSYRWIEWCSAPNVERGRVYFVARDATERKNAHLAMVESEARNRSLLESVPGIIMVTDLEGIVQQTSGEGNADSMLGRHITEAAAPEALADVTAAIEQVQRTGRAAGCEVPSPAYEENRSHWYAVRVGPIKRSGAVVGYTFVCIDIDERKALEVRLRESLVQAEHAARELEDQNKQLEAEIEARLNAEREINRQRAEMRAMSMPILEVWKGVLTVPVVGTIDTTRMTQFTERLLHEISRLGARAVIVDLTGADSMDEVAGQNIMNVVRSVALMGSHCLISGISPGVARAVTSLEPGAVYDLRTYASLRQALASLLAERRK